MGRVWCNRSDIGLCWWRRAKGCLGHLWRLEGPLYVFESRESLQNRNLRYGVENGRFWPSSSTRINTVAKNNPGGNRVGGGTKLNPRRKTGLGKGGASSRHCLCCALLPKVDVLEDRLVLGCFFGWIGAWSLELDFGLWSSQRKMSGGARTMVSFGLELELGAAWEL